MKRNTFLLTCLLFLFFTAPVAAQQFKFKNRWIDSTYNSLNETQRIGQLFMVAAYSGGPNANQEKIESLIRAGQIGGIIFMQGTAEAQAKLTNRYQHMSKVKLLIGMDAEWGLGMRLTGVKNLPRQMMIGATRDTALMYEMGNAVADQCRRLGVHVDFAPVIDINNNPKNPVINFRSFGEDKEWVTRLGIAYMKGLQDKGVMACAKHFPGHGDVATDSHLDLPVIRKSRAQLNELELYPFRRLIEAGVQSIMIAHLSIPALDNTKNLPSTLSRGIVTDLLKKEMKFDGLVFTDALDMKGLTKYYPDGETDLKAFMAGNDVLLFSQNVPLAIHKIQWAVQTGKISPEELERRVKKILAAKYDTDLFRFIPVKEQNVTKDLNSRVDELREKIAVAAVTLVRDRHLAITKLKAGKGKIAYLNINGDEHTPLEQALTKSIPQLQYNRLPGKTSMNTAKSLAGKYKDMDVVVVGVHNPALYPGKNGYYGLDSTQIFMLRQLSQQKNVIFAIMGNAYLVQHICNAGSIVVGYEDDAYAEEAVAAVLTGKRKATGILPVKPCK